jgi:hypothetical protein
MQMFERLVTVLVVLLFLPYLLGAIVQTVGTGNLLLILGVASVVAYLRRGGGAPPAGRRRTGSGSERTPLMPKGEE